jgi:hypothetical protein
MTKPPEILDRVKETLPSHEVLLERRETMFATQAKRKEMLEQRTKANSEENNL